MIRQILMLLCISWCIQGCNSESEKRYDCDAGDKAVPHDWNNATVYFMLTDRFHNADPTNDVNFGRTGETAVNRGFMGGDLAGITEKVQSGYFNELGVTAIWMTPFFEQIHGMVDEGTGNTYGFHGYWIKDWTTLDPNFGTIGELKQLIKAAHSRGIRIVMDVVINHTGPVTTKDPAWGDEWVRTSPRCTYENYRTTVTCTLVENLPDIRTESGEDVALPQQLLDKWASEGRLEEELEELDRFFEATGYPRAPKYYIIKWLTDYVRELGISAYRLDTAKHLEEEVWADLHQQAVRAYREWKETHSDPFPGEEFYMIGEVYNYGASGGRQFSFGDTAVDYFDHGIQNLINFEFKWDAQNSYEALFSKYSRLLHNELAGVEILNYLSSHDDNQPFDRFREKPLESATRLLLSPGGAQIYYGDETARLLDTEGAEGDARLRSFMNWDALEENDTVNGHAVSSVLEHYRKLGKFRADHPAIGAGRHAMISEQPYVFSRTFVRDDFEDRVVVALDQPTGLKQISTADVFPEGTDLTDSYSGNSAVVSGGAISIDTPYKIVLLSCKN